MTKIGFKLWILFACVAPQMTACQRHEEPASLLSQKMLYHCAMHPRIVSEKPGECPICHMKLTRLDHDATPVTEGERKLLFYRNPMQASVTSPVPMKDSMGMDYIPVYSNDDNGGDSHIPGQATIHLSSEVEQRIGVRVAKVERRELAMLIRAAARVAYDPQLYSATLEHGEAVKFLEQAKKSGSPESLEQAQATVRSSDIRLRQMGLSPSQIESIGTSNDDPSDLLTGSSGGHRWIYADVSDTQVGSIRLGQPVDLTSPALPGHSYKGTVRGIDPIVNSDTRTVRVRLRVMNADDALRPGIYLSASIHASLGQMLAVPESAVMDTGTRQLVYVQTEAGVYDPRPVRIGRQAEGYDEVMSGLQAGETVAVSANFLIDSESQIESAAQDTGH